MEEMTASSQIRSSRISDPTVADRWLLRVRGPVEVEIVDEKGGRIGRFLPREGEGEAERRFPIPWPREREDEGKSYQSRPNLFEITIPGATFNPGRDFVSAFLSQPGICTCRFFGQAPAAVDIYLTSFSVNTRLETIFFYAVPMDERSRAQFVYNTYELGEPVLIVEGGGLAPTQELRPTAILSASESQDTTPPTTQISMQGNMVVLSAADNPGGAGVLYTYYTTDGGTFAVYNGPFPLPQDAKILMAFSVDRNGNREYPGAVRPVLGVSASSIVFSMITRGQPVGLQSVSVMNLDPIPVSGSLEWVASTDVPWLLVEPREGKTPGLITLAVNVGEMGPGTYMGNVYVRSSMPQVVYGERVIAVVLEVSPGAGQGAD